MKRQTKAFADRRKSEVKMMNAIESLSTRSSVLNAFMSKDPRGNSFKSAKKQYLTVISEIEKITKELRKEIDNQEQIAIKRQTREKLREANIETFAPKEEDEDEIR